MSPPLRVFLLRRHARDLGRALSGQRLQMKSARFAFCQARFEFAAAVNGSAVRTQKPLAGNVLFEMYQKRDSATAVEGLVLKVE